MKKPAYMTWLVREDGVTIKDKIPLNCYRIDYKYNDAVLDEWALHIRRNYIEDDILKESADVNGMTVEDFLREYIIPQKGETLGATARSGDIAEIIISDLIEFVFNYSVPRYKMKNRAGKNSSQQGTDIIAYKYYNSDKSPHEKDELVSIEVKAALTKKDYTPIEKAIIDAKKDEQRLARTINYCRQRLNELGKIDESNNITRFLLKPDYNFKLISAAAGISSKENIDQIIELGISGEDLVISNNQMIFYVHGKQLMELAHNVYERCKR